ncbi:hypothetical protein SHL15_7862 [Streptomyces hygroscopicus subsp. limoneus]|nr:hypothetical protein SHL15_7862 [Streptomyces hygroscopicus subsp. limoneus]
MGRGTRPSRPVPSSMPPAGSMTGYAREWTAPGIDEEFEAVVDLLVRGLRTADGQR